MSIWRSLFALLLSCSSSFWRAALSIGPGTEAPPSVERARILDQSGDYAGAAKVYESLAAQNTGTEQNAPPPAGRARSSACAQARRCAARARLHRSPADAGAELREADARHRSRPRTQSGAGRLASDLGYSAAREWPGSRCAISRSGEGSVRDRTSCRRCTRRNGAREVARESG